MTNLIAELIEQGTRTEELIARITKQAEIEGIEPEILKHLLVTALKKRKLTSRHIIRLLPQELKRSYQCDKMSHITHKKVPDDRHAGITMEEVKALEDKASEITEQPTEYPPGEIELDLTKYGRALGDSARNGRKTARLIHDGINVLDVKY